MHTNSAKAVHTPGLLKSYFESDDLPPRGSFEVVTEPSGQRRFYVVCPGCMTLAPLALRPVVDGSAQSWEWNGSTEQPTLSPSIHHHDCWHGWLTAGELKSC